MKKIVTAIGNNILNEKLRETNLFEIIGNDIFYKEGIIELLKEKPKIDCLIISTILMGEIDFRLLIENIKRINSKIEMIVFLEGENAELENFLYSKGINKIYFNNEVEINELINLLQGENQNTDALNEEIKRLRSIIKEQQLNIEERKNSLQLGKITAITGAYGARQKYFNLYFM